MSRDKKFLDVFQTEMVGLLPRLWRFAVTLTRQRSLAEDLVQQTCQRALERRDQLVPGSKQDHWMFAIMSSIWKNQLRAEKIRRGLGSVDASKLWDDGEIARADESLMRSDLLRAISDLPGWQREAVLLVYVEHLSYGDAAQVLAIPLGTLMSRLAAAKLALAERLNAGNRRSGSEARHV